MSSGDIVREFYIDSISGSAVQFRPVPVLSPEPVADPTVQLHQVNVVTGFTAATNASTAYYQQNCTRYRISIERIS